MTTQPKQTEKLIADLANRRADLAAELRDIVAAAIADLAAELRDIVAKIENAPAMTQHHYGAYLQIFTTVAQGDKVNGGVLALALVEAGANSTGVHSAFKLAF